MAPGSTFGKSGAAPDAATCHMPGVATRRGVTNPRVGSIKNYGNKNFVSRRGGKKTIVQVATWNVRSLVNFSGPAGTAFVRQEFSEKNLSRKDDRRIDIVVDELRRLRIEVAGLQETLWFGRDIFSVVDSMVLTSGKKLPGPDGEFRRGGGVAVVLRGRALLAWRSGGSQWRPISSRLAVARLQTGGCRLHVIVCWDCRRLLLPLSRRCRRHHRRLSLPPLPSCRRRHRCRLSRRSCLRCTDWTVAPVIVLSASDVSRVLQDFVVIIVDVDWGLRIGTHTRMCVVRAGAASAF